MHLEGKCFNIMCGGVWGADMLMHIVLMSSHRKSVALFCCTRGRRHKTEPKGAPGTGTDTTQARG
jgi:hypothetical protein